MPDLKAVRAVELMKRILVANRGEIALRVIRSAREMGIETIAVYSDADRASPHVRMADHAAHVGPPLSSESYLNMDRIIEAALEFKADGIHPGYGFLSENATFSARVRKAGIIFIGPDPETIRMMGNKLEAKKVAAENGIPLVPGTGEDLRDISHARQVAREIGYPVLVKASAGGGGKGMRIVEQESDLESQVQRAISEASSAFGDGSVFLEKLIVGPRHIEIQILGDRMGNMVHLFERECSIQRRHQKVVEEAPSPVMTPALREQMGSAAVQVGRACNYVGAGTVEFLVDSELKYYFLEMNTRLQVEHPVTEAITGIDLVKEQLRIARDEPVSFRQSDLSIRGHAIELRVYAEDPENNFLPDIGVLRTYVRPQGTGIRVDDAMEQGMAIPIYYDPLIAKLIVHGNDRSEAISRMLRAIRDFEISGIATTLEFGAFVMGHEAFRSGNFDTRFINLHFSPERIRHDDIEEAAIAAFLSLMSPGKSEPLNADRPLSSRSDWQNNRKRLY